MQASHALLIGVNTYNAYDASLDQPEGTSNLQGSLNDVRSWLELCRDLGYPPENIRVLTTPALPEAELQGAQHGPATSEAIVAGVKWLAEALGDHREAGGILTFSGHGDQTHEGLVLCPSDTTADGDALQQVVHLLEIQKIIAEHDAGKNLTAVFDCCHSGDKDADGTKQSLALRKRGAPQAPQPIEVPAIGDRMYFAAEVGQCAYQATFLGRVHGAFTWAFMTTRDQWSIVDDNGHKQLNISYIEMQRRTRALMASLSFGQVPALRAPPSSVGLPLFHAGPQRIDDETSRKPTAERTRIQCDPGTKDYRVYTIRQFVSSRWTSVGTILVPRTSHGSYEAGTEYWYMSSNIVPNETLQFSWTDYDWSTTPSHGTLSFTMSQEAYWYATQPPRSGSTTFVNNDQGGFCLWWGMTLNGINWGGYVTWYSPTGQNTVFGGLPANYLYAYPNTTPTTMWWTTTCSPS